MYVGILTLNIGIKLAQTLKIRKINVYRDFGIKTDASEIVVKE